MDNLTVIIPYYNGDQEVLRRLLLTISSELPVIIADDTSDASPRIERPNCRVLRLPERGYFSGAVNYGAAACATDFVVVNQDSIFSGTDAFDKIAAHRAAFALIGEGVFNHAAWPQGYVVGTFMYIRRDAWQRVGPMDTRWYPLWGATCEWQLRACRKGYCVLPLKPMPGYKHLRHAGAHYGSGIRKALKREPAKHGVLIHTPPMVSVITPCYNYGRFLPDLVASLIGGQTSLGMADGQTFQGFELIIVDDGSTNAQSREIAQSLADRHKGIRVLMQDNCGTPCATNSGIRAAFGKYVTKLDADDMMKPERLERLLAAAEEHPDEFIYDDVHRFGSGKLIKTQQLPDFNPSTLLERNHVHSGILLRKEHWERVGGYPEQMREGREDWGMNINLAYHDICGYHIAEPLYLYRREGHNRTERNTTPDWHQRFLRQLREIFPDAYREGLMGCCGGKKKKVTPPALRMAKKASTLSTKGPSVAVNQLRAPVKGMSLLVYTGQNHSKSMFIGSVTGRRYVFSVSKNKNYVDARDVPDMLKIRENGKLVFKEITMAAAVNVKEIVPPVKEPEVVAPAVVLTEAEIARAADTDINHLIDDLRRIRGVGFALARRFIDNGFVSVEQLAHSEAEAVSATTGMTIAKVQTFIDKAKVLIGELPA